MSLLGLGVVIYSIESIITLSKTLQYLYSISTNEEYKRKVLLQIEHLNRKIKEHFNRTLCVMSMNPIGIHLKKIRRKILPKITQSWDNSYDSIDMDFIKIDDIDDFHEVDNINENDGLNSINKNHINPELFYSCQDALNRTM